MKKNKFKNKKNDDVIILSGKNKPEYTPNADIGDFVVVVNAKDIHVTGKKEEQKRYYRHSGYLVELNQSF